MNQKHFRPATIIGVSTTPSSFRERHHFTYLAIYLGGISLLLAMVAVFAYTVDDKISNLENYLNQLGPWRPVAFVLTTALLSMLFVPQAVLSLAGGVLFGISWGLVVIFLSELIAAWWSFLLARHLAHPTVHRFIDRHPRFGVFNRAPLHDRFRLMFLMRLAPVNFSILNYVCAVSDVKLWRYLIACIGVLPGNLAVIYAGYVAHHINRRAAGKEDYPLMHYILLIGGLVLAVVTSFLIARSAWQMIKAVDQPATTDQGTSPSHN